MNSLRCPFTIVCIALSLILHAQNQQSTALNQINGPVSAAVTSDVLGFTANGVSFNMVKVDGGTFRMGATEEQGDDAGYDERPVHFVTLSDYYIGQTEVTQLLWEAVMGESSSLFSQLSKCVGPYKPAYNLSYDDCKDFISRLNKLLSSQLGGWQFALPTEAQWEFAARGGNKTKGYKYSGGNNLSDVAWHEGNSESSAHPVAQKSPNELGLYDMSGNVWEWCADWKGSYSSEPQTNPTGPAEATYRVVRGGGWREILDGNYRVSDRHVGTPSKRGLFSGLRLCLVSGRQTGSGEPQVPLPANMETAMGMLPADLNGPVEPTYPTADALKPEYNTSNYPSLCDTQARRDTLVPPVTPAKSETVASQVSSTKSETVASPVTPVRSETVVSQVSSTKSEKVVSSISPTRSKKVASPVSPTKSKKSKKTYGWENFIRADYAYDFVGENHAVGITYGRVKLFGYYASLMLGTDMHYGYDYYRASSYQIYEKNSKYVYTNINPFYTGKGSNNWLSVTAGGVVRMGVPVYLYLGVGYTYYSETRELIGGKWLKELNENGNHNFNWEVGLQCNIKGFTFSAGYFMDIPVFEQGIKVGIGATF